MDRGRIGRHGGYRGGSSVSEAWRGERGSTLGHPAFILMLLEDKELRRKEEA